MPTYTYVSVDRVTPKAGPTSGGTAVTITGSGFGFATGGVTFGGVAATSVVIVSPTSITCVTPIHASGAVDVEVEGVDTLSNGYTYTIGQALLPPIPYLSPMEAEEGRVSNPYFLWLTTLKQRVEGLPGDVPAESIIGVLNVDNIPQLPFTRIDLTTAPRLLGRTTAGAGAAEEIRVAGGLTLSGGILSLAGLPGGYVIGDLLYADSDHTLARLPDVSVGSYLRSGGVATAPLWSTLKLPNTATAGDLLYASAANSIATLAKDTNATRYLSNTGGSNNPAWAQVNLVNGVAGTLPVGNGGTGTSSIFTAGSVVFAGASGVYSQDNANLFWDDSNNRLGIGTASPNEQLELTGNLRLPATSSTAGIVQVAAARFLHSFGTGNTFLGAGSGNTTLTTSQQNAGVGMDALAALTTGAENVAVGWGALKILTTGSRNVALGRATLFANVGGSDNVAIGQNSLVSFTGNETTAVGKGALGGLTTGVSCTAVGFNALTTIATNSLCTAVGYSALNNAVANQNTAIGYQAGITITTGADNTFLGSFADAGSNAIAKSTAIGKSAVVSQSNHVMLGTDTECVGIAGAARPSTGTGALMFPDGTAPSSLGSNTAGLYANDVGGTVNMFGINEAGTVTQLTGLTSAYTITNVTTDRSYDANATTLDEIADTLGTLIADLQARGVCG